VLTKFVHNIDGGAHFYWQVRVLPHPIRWFVLFVLFCVIEIVLLPTVSLEFSLVWLVMGISFLVGDITSLIKVARCQNCGILVSPAPAFKKECPACGHIIQP
jgi:hypothetical protein